MKAPACTINRSVRDIARVKDKIRDQELRSKQYNSLCYDIGFENADPNHLEREREGKGEGERKGSRRDRDKER